MAGRSNTTLKKRQKEMARAEKARDKAAKRLDRKNGIFPPEQPDEEETLLQDSAEDAVPAVLQP